MDLEISLDPRTAAGKANRRLRRQGIVPGVVFGNGRESVPVQVDAKELETLYRAAGRTSIVQLKVGSARRPTSAIIKGVQRHPLSRRALHVDFFVVDLTQEMQVDVPLVFTGEAPAVDATGGTLFTNLDHLKVKALPADLPHEITVDVSSLVDLDAAVHVRDIAIDGDGVHVLNDPDELVAKVVPPRVEEEPEPVAAAEAVETEAAEGAAEGEAAPVTAAEGETEREPA
jgi:large subunit ribosomal protein L25